MNSAQRLIIDIDIHRHVTEFLADTREVGCDPSDSLLSYREGYIEKFCKKPFKTQLMDLEFEQMVVQIIDLQLSKLNVNTALLPSLQLRDTQ